MDKYEILRQYFGYNTFRPLQEEVIDHTLCGGSSLVLMPTGGGKSLCFQVAALMMKGVTVVVSPLISLMKDQVDAARAAGIPAEALNSAADAALTREVMQRTAEGRVKLLYMSPERAMSDIDSFLRYLPISLFAIDEAHCISTWGHDFRPEYIQLGRLRKAFPNVPIMALTATADRLTRADVLEQLHIPDARTFVASFDRPNISLDVRRGYTERERIKEIVDLAKKHTRESGIVYCLSRKTSEKVCQRLCEEGVSAGVYHAGMDTAHRQLVQDEFVADHLQVVCATIAFGMGIDKSNVRFVVHFNMPKSIENYYQEVGRGGRDGLPCETILFYNLQDVVTLRHFAEESGQRDVSVEKLRRMQEYAEAVVCRRRILLNYFGEPSDSDCHNCDVCHHPPQTFDGTVAVQKALSGILRTGQHVGFSTLIDILKGTSSEEVVAHGYQQLKTFGAGMDVPARMWHDFLLQMLQQGFIEIAYDEDRHLRVTTLGNEVLRGERQAPLSIVEHDVSKRQRHSDGKAVNNKKPKTRHEPRQRKPLPHLPSDPLALAPGSTLEQAHPDSEAMASESLTDDSLFTHLKTLRAQIAEREGVAPHNVLSDRSLLSVAQTMPAYVETFAQLEGIGRHRVAAYGDEFVSAVREYMESKGIPLPDPPAKPVRPPRNYFIINGTRYDVDSDIWDAIPWRDVVKDIRDRAYWNYRAEQRLDLAVYIPLGTLNRQRVVDTLCHILAEAYHLPTDAKGGVVSLPLKVDYDSAGNIVQLPEGSFDTLLAQLRDFIVDKGRYPFLDAPRQEASLRKWFREVGHGLIDITDEQRKQFTALNDEFAAFPKSRAQLEKNNGTSTTNSTDH